MKESSVVKFPDIKLGAAAVLAFLGLLGSALPGCKDEEPCDPGQESIGTGCRERRRRGGRGR